MKSKLYFWGANSHGQSGTGTVTEQYESPTLVPFEAPERIQKIVGGGGHSLILTTSGELFGCGWNNTGQVGLSSTTFQQLPFTHFDSIAAGWDVSAGIKAGKCLFWGNDRYEQFRDDIDGTRDLSFGLRHTLVQYKNRLALFGKSKCVKLVQERDLPAQSLRIASGQHHVIVQTTPTQLICLGDNKFAQCVSIFNHDREILRVFAGWTHSGFLDADGNVYMWGRNNYFQLGQETVEMMSNKPLRVDIEKVVEIQSGSEHVVARTEDGAVYAWGWNEHGNVGNGGTKNVSKPTRVKLPGQCQMLGTGAGFTFAVVE